MNKSPDYDLQDHVNRTLISELDGHLNDILDDIESGVTDYEYDFQMDDRADGIMGTARVSRDLSRIMINRDQMAVIIEVHMGRATILELHMGLEIMEFVRDEPGYAVRRLCTQAIDYLMGGMDEESAMEEEVVELTEEAVRDRYSDIIEELAGHPEGFHIRRGRNTYWIEDGMFNAREECRPVGLIENDP